MAEGRRDEEKREEEKRKVKVDGKAEKSGQENQKKRTKAGTILLAGVICMAAVIVLLVGMGLYAGKTGNRTEQIGADDAGATEKMTDVIGDVLADDTDMREEEQEGGTMAGSADVSGGGMSQEDDAGKPYASVPILTWDEYYALGPDGKNDPNITGQGIMGTWSENKLTMEEAGTLGLREIYRVFGDDVDFSEMYLRMILFNEGDRKWDPADIWYGYMSNFVNGDTPEPGWKMQCYAFEMNAVTGEIYLLDCSVDEREWVDGQQELVGVDELKSNADRYLEQLDLIDPSELTVETVRVDGESLLGSGVAFSRGGEPYLEIMMRPYSGRLRGYRYITW